MKKRILKETYQYGKVLDGASMLYKQHLARKIGLKKLFKDKKVLDLGCGFGTSSAIISEFAGHVTGLDILKYKEWGNFESKKISFVKASASKIPFKDNTFDGVYLKDLLHHVKDIDTTLSEIKRVTKDKGTIIILEGNRYNPLFFLYATKLRGHDHFTHKQLKVLVKKFFPNTKFIRLDAYPPFRLSESAYTFFLKIQDFTSKITALNFLFCYNLVIIKNKK